jgi:hypothetical protein
MLSMCDVQFRERWPSCFHNLATCHLVGRAELVVQLKQVIVRNNLSPISGISFDLGHTQGGP